MTTKTHLPADIEQAMIELDVYVAKTLPAYLRPETPPPPSWPHSPEAWRVLQQSAAGSWSEQAMLAYVQQLAKGWTPDEMATGKGFGMEVRPDGSPVRPRMSSLSAYTISQASRALAEADKRALHIGELEMTILQQATAGAGDEKRVKAVAQGVMGLVSVHDAAAKAAAYNIATSPVLTVRSPFRGKRGLEYTPGTYHVTEETAGELRAWQTENEAMAARHGWDAPSGFQPDIWPPFTLTPSAAPTDDELWRGD